MPIHIETPRLILRELDYIDENDLYEMDSDPLVHRYINQDPVTSMERITAVIKMLQQQYKDNGIARWAVVDKITNECLGWCGIKYFTDTMNGHSNFYEHGYRFKQKYWGKGYATESSIAIIDYAFERFGMEAIYATTDLENLNSKNVLRKLQFENKGHFIYDEDGRELDWFELKKADWLAFKDSGL